jgi:tetratricopeptide (TPR) repeat protein
MNLNFTKTLVVACGLTLAVSTLVGSAWARGSGGGGGRSSGGMGHYSSSQHISNNFARTTPTNFAQHNFTQNFNSVNRNNNVNRVNNFTKFNTTKNFSSIGKFKNGLNSKNFQFQKLSKNGSKGPFWKKYGSWGKFWGPWGYNFGWGWGCWDSPFCYGWCEYEPIPVVAYYNPYCDCAGSVVDGVDYSTPIANLPTNSVPGNDTDAFAAAREAFGQGDFDTALKAISVAVLQQPHNQDVHQFHSLVLFAKRDYCKSAAVAHAVLEEGPGWTWDALQTCYASPEIYTEQLRGLEHFVGQNPSNANVRFLLGYHYLMLNHGEAAQRQLGQVVELESKDKLAANILTGLKSEATARTEIAKTETTKTAPTKTAPSKTDLVIVPTKADSATIAPAKAEIAKSEVTKPEITKAEKTKSEVEKSEVAKSEPVKTELATSETTSDSEDDATDSTVSTTSPVKEQLALAVDAVPLSGTWKATPAKGVQIELTLRTDKTFTWKFTANGKTQNFSGKYELGDKSLVLTREDGESMDGSFERHGNAGFKFRMKDAEADDPGLNFSR